MAPAAASESGRGRGRPARLSAEQITLATVELLQQEPNAAVTVKRVADAVGAAPMALYRYFPDREALLQAAADHVVATMARITLDDGPWQQRLSTWMRAAHERLLPYPQLLPYMVSTQQPAWLPMLLRCSELLAPLELGEDDLALAAVLIGSSIIGHAVYESRRRSAEQTTAVLYRALEDRPAAEQDAIRPLVDGLPAAYARLHDTVLGQTIATVEALAQRGER
jgi:TetR/AcrR family transcriptional regulator, tetracycline repressor protein